MTNEQIKLMVNRFLTWKLPQDFDPDGGVSFEKGRTPVGTNLLTAVQAETMIRHMLGLNTLGMTTLAAERAERDALHPSPQEFTDEEIKQDHILQFFHYAHLPEALRGRSRPFCVLAREIVDTTPRNPERTVALRKLLEAKDANVRAFVAK